MKPTSCAFFALCAGTAVASVLLFPHLPEELRIPSEPDYPTGMTRSLWLGMQLAICALLVPGYFSLAQTRPIPARLFRDHRTYYDLFLLLLVSVPSLGVVQQALALRSIELPRALLFGPGVVLLNLCFASLSGRTWYADLWDGVPPSKLEGWRRSVRVNKWWFLASAALPILLYPMIGGWSVFVGVFSWNLILYRMVLLHQSLSSDGVDPRVP